ncbi:MAG: pseudouridine synthase [Phycisphaerales bacterium]
MAGKPKSRARHQEVTRIPVRRTRRSGPQHDYQDDQRGPRIQKVLAEAGIDSRRACEELVEQGRVTVNGQMLDGLPAWVNPETDDIRVDGRRLQKAERHVYVVLFKPKGILSTNSDPEGRRLAIELVQHPSKARLYPVGRLDIDSSGLLLLTNDGALANRLTHPRFELAKGYEITVSGRVEGEELERLRAQIFPRRSEGAGERAGARAGERTGERAAERPDESQLVVLKRDAQKTLLYLEFREGRNRDLRRVLGMLGHPLKKLRRVRMGPLLLKGLQPGEWRDLTRPELHALRDHAFATPQERAERKHSTRAQKGKRGPHSDRTPRAARHDRSPRAARAPRKPA